MECITTLHFCVKVSETSELVGGNSDVLVVWMGRNLECTTIEFGWKYKEETERTDLGTASEDIIKAMMQTI